MKTKIAPGLYRLAPRLIVFRKKSRALRLTGHNRGGNATTKCTTWVTARTGYDDANLLDFLNTTDWRRCPGDEAGEFDTLMEAVSSVV